MSLHSRRSDNCPLKGAHETCWINSSKIATVRRLRAGIIGSHHGRVEPTLLKWGARDHDRARLFTAELRIKLSAEDSPSRPRTCYSAV